MSLFFACWHTILSVSEVLHRKVARYFLLLFVFALWHVATNGNMNSSASFGEEMGGGIVHTHVL